MFETPHEWSEHMHEIALMGDILNIVSKDMEAKGLKKMNKVTVVVGDLSNAMPDALEMAFDIYKAQKHDCLHPDAILRIEREEAQAKCVFCGEIYTPEQKIALCPKCNMPGGQLISGETFQVISYEGE